MKVLIVGGGVAGIAAGVECCSRGHEVVLLEKQARLGGRACTFTGSRLGIPLDLGAHVILRCYENLLRLLTQLGSRGNLTFEKGSLSCPFLDLETKETRHLRLANLPVPFHLVGGLLGFRPSLGDMIAALHLTSLVFGPTGPPKELDKLTVREYLEGKRQSENLIRRLWGPLCTSVMNETAERASAAPFETALRHIFFKHRDGAAAASISGSLAAIFAEPARRFLEDHGAKILLKSKVERLLVSTGGEVEGVFLKSGEAIRADKVIVAVPAWEFPSLARGTSIQDLEFVRRIRELETGSILTVYFWTDKPLSPDPRIGLIGGTAEWVFHCGEDRLKGGEKAYRIAAVMSAAGRLGKKNAKTLQRMMWEDLRRTFRSADEARVYDSRVVKVVRATPSFVPGTQILRPPVNPPVKDLFLAGDYVDTGLPATLEGACLSGFNAAAEALGRVRKKPSLQAKRGVRGNL
jgi:squalene-associated FAD-dependent desaturase